MGNGSHPMCKGQAHACCKLSPRLHHVESREANNMPEEICGRGICDLNGVVQLPLVTEWLL